MNRITHLFILFITIVFISCTSEEYTSAKLYLQQKDYEKAEEFLVKAMSIEPENPEIPFQLGHHIYGRSGRWKEMNEAFNKALSINPQAKILDGRPVSEFVAMSRYQFWTDAYNQGVQNYNNAKNLESEEKNVSIRKAIDEFNSAADIKPDEGLTYTMLATCFYDLGEIEKSIEIIVKAVEMSPEDFNANAAAGQIMTKNGKPNEALPYLEKAVNLNPQNLSAIRTLAQTYYDIGNTKASIATYEKAIKATTDNQTKADLHFNLGVLYNQVEDFDAAEDHFTIALDLNPSDVEAILGMAQTFESNERWRKAEKFYKELIYLEPENASHYRGIARVLLQQGKQDQAQRYFNKSKKYE
ncbi:MAG: tetratricopeptide repeat protein [Fidelibacterota bacterium]